MREKREIEEKMWRLRTSGLRRATWRGEEEEEKMKESRRMEITWELD